MSNTACVVGCSVISFVGDLTVDQKNDVMNSTLFAQISANNLFDRLDETQTQSWYDKYTSYLDMVGWVVSRFSFTDLEEADSMGSVDAAVLSVMPNIVSPDQITVLQNAIDMLKQPVNAEAYDSFKQVSWNIKNADFHVGICEANPNGTIFRMGAFRYDTSDFNGDVLYSELGSNLVNFKSFTQEMVLNEKVYAGNRQIVLTTLAGAVVGAIAGIEL